MIINCLLYYHIGKTRIILDFNTYKIILLLFNDIVKQESYERKSIQTILKCRTKRGKIIIQSFSFDDSFKNS